MKEISGINVLTDITVSTIVIKDLPVDHVAALLVLIT
jgi:hypothetical protein